MANKSACRGVRRPRTSGRLRVRDISPSYAGSRYMLNAFALAALSAVPAVRNVRVSAERVGTSERSGSTGKRAYEAIALRTISAVRRGLQSAR